MNKIRTFFNTYAKSISSPAYYIDVVKAPTSFSVKYFLVLGVLTALILTGILGYKFSVEYKVFVKDAYKEALAIYPSDLVFTVANNEWSINKPEPYIIPFPEDMVKEMNKDAKDKFPSNMIIIDHEGTIDDLEVYDSLMLLNGRNIIYRNDNKNKIEAVPIEEWPDGVVTKDTYVIFLDKLREYAPALQAIIIIGMLIGLLIGVAGNLLIVQLFTAFLVWIISSIKGTKLGFGDCYKVGLHAVTLSITINTVLMIIGKTIPVPMWYTLVTMLYAVAAVFAIDKANKPTAPQIPTTPQGQSVPQQSSQQTQ